MKKLGIIMALCSLHAHIGYASQAKLPEQIKKIIPKIDSKLNSKLFEAVQKGDTSQVSDLLNPQWPWYWGGGIKSIPDVNAQYKNKHNHVPLISMPFSGWTPLMWAAMKGDTEMVKLLLAAGAQPHLTSDSGDTALFIAARFHKYKTMELLLSAGAQPMRRFWKAKFRDPKVIKVIDDYNKEVEQEKKAITCATAEALSDAGWQDISKIIGEYAARPLVQEQMEIKEKSESENQL